jgi:hypothetical protein
VQASLIRVKVANLSERGETKGVLGTLVAGMEEAGKMVVDGEVNRQIEIYYNCKY